MIDKPFLMPQPIQPVNKRGLPQVKKPSQSTTFNQILEKEIAQNQELKFSRHARERLDARRIVLNEEQVSRLNSAVEKAQNKGCRESLILLDDLAFVVSVSNKTVITAVNGESIKENVFTNIDSAVIN
jgi:flagellar operon protein